MRNARTLLLGVVCLLIAGLTVQALCQARFGNQPLKHRLEERKRASGERPARNRSRTKEEFEQYGEKLRKEAEERSAIFRAEFLQEKAALNPTPEQWKLIKPLLEKIRQLRDRPRSTAGLSLTSSTTSGRRTRSRSRPLAAWRWRKPWEDTPQSRWTKGQSTADELIALVGSRRTSEAAFTSKMEALRECRRQEAAEKKAEKIEVAISETQQKLRGFLSARQEATLVLMRWL